MVNLNTKITQNVEILCKSLRKTQCKSIVNLRAKLKIDVHSVEISTFTPTFSHFFANFPTTIHNLFPPGLFHFFTDPTITIINNLKERILNGN